MTGIVDTILEQLGLKTKEKPVVKKKKNDTITITGGYVQEIILVRYIAKEDNELVTFVVNMTKEEWDELDENARRKYIDNITLATIYNSTGLPGLGRHVGIDASISRGREQDSE